MNVSCPKCETVFRVDPAKVPVKGVRARCSSCSAVFFVGRPTEPSPSVTGSDTAAVAAQALDALAQGLAASAAASTGHASAIPLTPVVDPAQPAYRPQPIAASAALAPQAAPAAGGASRTLEDAVADMLRPMLQQWVAENMPRIIEKALRVEVAQTVKPGSKPPGA